MHPQTITAHGFTGFLGKGLSLRELQCVLGIAAGRTSKELARDLGMQPGTVGKRVLAATTKLGVTRRAALVAEAMRRGLISPAVIALAFLVAGQPLLNDDHMMRSRRGGERKIETRLTARGLGGVIMAWDRNDPLNILALQLDGELRAAADFCHGYNGPAQRAFARHIQGLGKSVDELTVADLKAAAAFAEAELNDLQQRGLI